jgi:hypothetical protein
VDIEQTRHHSIAFQVKHIVSTGKQKLADRLSTINPYNVAAGPVNRYDHIFHRWTPGPIN